MADFCKQCSLEIFGEDCGDLAGLCPDNEGEDWWPVVLCEDCGPTQVNNDGACISDCDKQHHQWINGEALPTGEESGKSTNQGDGSAQTELGEQWEL